MNKKEMTDKIYELEQRIKELENIPANDNHYHTHHQSIRNVFKLAHARHAVIDYLT